MSKIDFIFTVFNSIGQVEKSPQTLRVWGRFQCDTSGFEGAKFNQRRDRR